MVPAAERALDLETRGAPVLLTGCQNPGGDPAHRPPPADHLSCNRKTRESEAPATKTVEAPERQHTAVTGETATVKIVLTITKEVVTLNEKISETDKLMEGRFREHEPACAQSLPARACGPRLPTPRRRPAGSGTQPSPCESRGHAQQRATVDGQRDGPTHECRPFGEPGVAPTPGTQPPPSSSTPSPGMLRSWAHQPPEGGAPCVNITTTIHGTTARITPYGDIDFDTLPPLRAAAEALPAHVTDLIRDLNHTAFMDTAGLHLLCAPRPPARPPGPSHDRDRTTPPAAAPAAPGRRPAPHHLRQHPPAPRHAAPRLPAGIRAAALRQHPDNPSPTLPAMPRTKIGAAQSHDDRDSAAHPQRLAAPPLAAGVVDAFVASRARSRCNGGAGGRQTTGMADQLGPVPKPS